VGGVTRVAVVGSLNADLVVEVPRLPLPGETVLGGDIRRSPGGKGGNQAVAAARLGADVLVVATVGDDDLGRLLVDDQRKEGVDVSGVAILTGLPTGTALITVEPGGENTIAVASGANRRLDEQIVRRHQALLENTDVLLLQLEVPLEASLAAASMVREAGGLVVLSAAPVPPRPSPPLLALLLDTVHVVVLNEGEARSLDTDGLLAQAQQTRIVTLGARGAHWTDNGGSGTVPALPVHAVDAVGAGDTFAGALAVALGQGQPLEDAVRFCCAAAALTTMTPGAQAAMPTTEDVMRVLQEATRA